MSGVKDDYRWNKDNPKERDEFMSTDYGRRILATLVGFAILATAGVALGAQFKPFKDVENVCPDCETGPEFDVVEMNDGLKVRAKVIAENADFFVLERFGETRAAPKSGVAAIQWAEGSKPANLNSQDQIVLNNGHVMTGEVVDESDKPGHLQLKSSVGDFSFVIFKTEAESLYRQGKKTTIEMAESAEDSGGETGQTGGQNDGTQPGGE